MNAIRWIVVTMPAFLIFGGILHFPGVSMTSGWNRVPSPSAP